MGGQADDQQSPFLGGSYSSSTEPEGSFKRSGTLWTAVAHVITGVIGAGVLSLAWSVAQLGWIGGPLLILAFAGITLISTFLLADFYRYPDPENGPIRNPQYIEAVRLYLGKKMEVVSSAFVYESFYGVGIAYTITSATSIKAILKSNCYHKEGHSAACKYGDRKYMLLFGGIQILMSQIPNLHDMEWLSSMAAIMSFTYSFIGFGLGFAKVIENGSIKGSISGVSTTNISDKIWLAFEALGDVAFAYPYSIIVLEIQDTLRSPPPENQTMKKASTVAIFVTTVFYLCCGCFGYAAFGNDTPGNLLTGFGFYNPFWLIDLANACIVLHLLGGYQMYSQPVFGAAERWFSGKFPSSNYVNKNHDIKLPWLPGFQLNLFRLSSRCAYVASTTALAILFPYFNEVLGVLGALNFWPLAIYFPVQMYFVQRKIRRWTRTWIVLEGFSCFCFLVSLMGLIGSLEGLIDAKLS